MNSLDKQYQELLKTILEYGVDKKDRTGTGTKSIFGYTIRHNMKNGFPLLTTKKMYWKGIVTELLWFLRGDTNIKYLVDNGCHIWDSDAYKAFERWKQETDAKIRKENPTIDFQPLEYESKEEFINKIKTDDEFAKTWGDLGPVYGKQWADWGGQPGYLETKTITDTNGSMSWPERVGKSNGINQIQNAIDALKNNPDSRRIMVSAWNVGELDQMTLPPCHYGFQVYTRELTFEERTRLYNKTLGEGFEDKKWFPNEDFIESRLKTENIPTRTISLMWNQRSVDTFLGLPFNIASYGLLLEIIAKLVNMVPDELIGNLGDVHLYKNHIEQAKEQLTREPMKLPTLNINTEFWNTESGECGVGQLDTNINCFTNDDFCKCLLEEDIQLANYESHPTIKAPLSN